MKYPGSVFFFLVCLLGLAAVYSFLPISQLFDAQTRGVSLKFDTPDEMINYAFALNFQKTNRLYYVEYVNDYFPHPIVFPRWARTDGAFVYPGTFLGMIIFAGSVAKIVGTIAIPFITPIIAVLLVLISYSLVKRFFDKHVAFISAITLALLPVFLYYASRTMFHTILFLFFILLGVWLYLKAFEDDNLNENEARSTKHEVRNSTQIQNSKFKTFRIFAIRILNLFRISDFEFRIYLFYYLSALSFGLALFIRFADIWWVLLTILALMLYKRMDLKRIVVFFGVFGFAVIPVFLLNHVLYGNWLDFGYATISEEASTTSSEILKFFLPFGFHPRVMWNVFVDVLIKPYWWFFVVAVVGYWFMVRDFWKIYKREILLLTTYYLLLTIYLLTFYGSWKFSDSIDPNAVAISSSYYRYFLPLFILAIPFVGYAVSRILQYVIARSPDVASRRRGDLVHSSKEITPGLRSPNTFGGVGSQGLAMTTIIKWFLIVFLFSCFLVFSYSKAYLGEEGLLHVRRQVLWYRQQVKILKERGASYNDLFLVKRGQDKILFPEFPKVVNVDYIDSKLFEESLKKYKGILWESKNGAFQKQ